MQFKLMMKMKLIKRPLNSIQTKANVKILVGMLQGVLAGHGIAKMMCSAIGWKPIARKVAVYVQVQFYPSMYNYNTGAASTSYRRIERCKPC